MIRMRGFEQYIYKINKPIRFVNWWQENYKDNWFYKFIESRKICLSKKITFYSVFGPKLLLIADRSYSKVFYSGENLCWDKTSYKKYRNILTLKNIDLCLGYEYIQSDRYLRFPLWLMYMFDPTLDNYGVKRRCEHISSIKFPKQKFASLVASWCPDDTRLNIFNAMSLIGRVDSDGRYLNNNNDLKGKYGDNKYEYLKEYKFNICPENSNSAGYVTEKLFEALDAGCIPVYYGGMNNPEPEVVDQNAVLFWEQNSDNLELMRFIKKLNDSDDLYNSFVSQKRFMPTACDYIINCFDELDRKLRSIV